MKRMLTTSITRYAAIFALVVSVFGTASGQGQSLQIRLVGQPEIVYEQPDASDYIDSPARAWYDPSGEVHMIAPWTTTYPFVGSSLFSAKKDFSAPIYSSEHDPDYWAAKNSEFPTAVHADDQGNAWALVHNEWHLGCSGQSWVNSITVLESNDGGKSFHHPDDYIVRGPVTPWSDSFCAGGASPAFGSFNPVNIMVKDGWYYSMFYSIAAPDGSGSNGAGTCVMRSQTPGIGSSWQVWTGTAWAGHGGEKGVTATYSVSCQPVMGVVPFSLNYSSYLQKFVATVGYGTPDDVQYGVATSDDLVQWSGPTQIPIPVNSAKGVVTYLSLMGISQDPAVTGLNFENVDQDAYLYWVALNPDNMGAPPRFLMRQEIVFDDGRTSDPGSSPALTAIHREYSGETTWHMMTMYPVEDSDSYHDEGVGFQLYANPIDEDVAMLYRCRYGGGFFASIDSGCEGQTYDYPLGWVHSYQAEGEVPIYRFYNPSNGDHLITMHLEEGGGLPLEGILGYAQP